MLAIQCHIYIIDRCRRSSAVVTPVIYECHSYNRTGTFARSNNLLTEKLTNGVLMFHQLPHRMG